MIEYRPAGLSDAEAIAHLHAQSWRQNYRGAFRDEFLDGDLYGERLRVWRERLDRPPSNQLVRLAVGGGILAGFVCAYAAHDSRWGSLIDNVHVSHDFKRHGIASNLMRQAGAWLASVSPDHGVYLLVLEVNGSARRFYETVGGENAGVSTMETHGGAIVRSCRYVWSRPATLATSRCS